MTSLLLLSSLSKALVSLKEKSVGPPMFGKEQESLRTVMNIYKADLPRGG